ncbi:Ubiquitin-conjugating enzyme E2 D3 [Nymphon striatum]|nr:Ubiquitin-conjugating enzyme E2 D3 [Nymphon striatum]
MSTATHAAIRSSNEEASLGIIDFRHKDTACSICNGFYGPNFGEPVCATCHAFLFPGDVSLQDVAEVYEEKTDSGDSGNEEPTDFYEQSTAVLYRRQEHSQSLSNAFVSNKSADKLAEQINFLTFPRKFKDNVPDGVLDLLPPEVLLGIFSYLDDVSLWCVGQVCRRWQQLLESNTAQDQWKLYTLRRWPLIHFLYKVKCWRRVYTSLIKSAPCLLCLLQMSIQMKPSLSENSWRTNRLRNELKSIKSDPPEGIEATPLDELCCHWQASITGPVGSPYEGGTFFLYLQIPHSDSSAAQYKNHKNLANLMRHYEDFGLSSEWHFFATSHGKSPCDGMGGTVKRSAARASLQATTTNYILTSTDLFTWAQKNIINIHFIWVGKEKVNMEEDVSRVSDEPGFTLEMGGHRPQVATAEKTTLHLDDMVPGTYVTCIYDGQYYPMRPPLVRFITKIFHPNVSRHGDIGIDSINHNWSLALTISKILISIQSLLTDPYCIICMEPQIGKLYLEDKVKFNRISQLWTWRYAMPHALMPSTKYAVNDEFWHKLSLAESMTHH